MKALLPFSLVNGNHAEPTFPHFDFATSPTWNMSADDLEAIVPLPAVVALGETISRVQAAAKARFLTKHASASAQLDAELVKVRAEAVLARQAFAALPAPSVSLTKSSRHLLRVSLTLGFVGLVSWGMWTVSRLLLFHTDSYTTGLVLAVPVPLGALAIKSLLSLLPVVGRKIAQIILSSVAVLAAGVYAYGIYLQIAAAGSPLSAFENGVPGSHLLFPAQLLLELAMGALALERLTDLNRDAEPREAITNAKAVVETWASKEQFLTGLKAARDAAEAQFTTDAMDLARLRLVDADLRRSAQNAILGRYTGRAHGAVAPFPQAEAVHDGAAVNS